MTMFSVLLYDWVVCRLYAVLHCLLFLPAVAPSQSLYVSQVLPLLRSFNHSQCSTLAFVFGICPLPFTAIAKHFAVSCEFIVHLLVSYLMPPPLHPPHSHDAGCKEYMTKECSATYVQGPYQTVSPSPCHTCRGYSYPPRCILLLPSFVSGVADPLKSLAKYPSSMKPEYSDSYSSVQHNKHRTGASNPNNTSSPLSSSTFLPSANFLTHLNIARHTLNAEKPKDSLVVHDKHMKDLDTALRELGVELPRQIIALVARRDTGATTMERFLAEDSCCIPGYGTKGPDNSKR